MTMLSRLGGEWKTIVSGKIYASGAWRTLVAIKVYAGGAWRDVANLTPSGTGGGGGGTLSLNASPNPCEGSSTVTPITTGPCTVTPSGGQAPYTYAWSIVSGSCTIISPTSATTRFTKGGIIPRGTTATATARCDVTDSLGVAASVTVSVLFTHEFDDSGTA